MDLSPTITMTDRDKAALAEAKERLRAAKKLSPKHDAAIAKHRALTEQQSFLAVGSAVPRELVLQILGNAKDQGLRELGDVVGERIGKSVDLLGLVRKLATRVRMPAAGGREVARTYAELADKLGMKQGDPERTLKTYYGRGMPGKPGSRGKANGEFDAELCRMWIAANVRSGGGVTDEELQATRKEITHLDLQRKKNDLLEQAGRLVDVDEQAAYVTSCIANAKAVLEGVPDVVLEALPSDTQDDVRLSIHTACTGVIDTVMEELARAAEADEETADGDGEAAEASGGRVAPASAGVAG